MAGEEFVRFRALETFECAETRSVYMAGLEYTAREPLLRELARGWLKEGKVEAVEGASRAFGTGVIT